MNVPPLDPRHRPIPNSLTWRGILVGYAALAAFALSLWVVGRPLVRATGLVAAGGLLVGARRGARLAWCLHTCRAVTVGLVGDLQVTVSRAGSQDRRTCGDP